MNKPASLIAIVLAVLRPAFGQVGQLYLIVGSPTPKYEVGYSTSLATVAPDGSVKTVQEIVPAKFGTEWTAVSYDNRKALILPKFPDDHIIVFDFDTLSVVKSCQPHTTDLLLVGQWLVDSPLHGLVFAEYLVAVNRQKTQDQFLGMIMDPTVPCEKSFVKLDASELKDVIAHGFAGVADLAGHDSMDASVGLDGTLSDRWLSGEQTYYDYKVPLNLLNGVKHASTILINNRQIFGLALTDSSDRRFFAFRKSDNTWHQVPDPSAGRGFGNFIASPEAHVKLAGASGSAGKAEWRQEETLTGPPTIMRLSAHRVVYPGVLHLYDAATERSYTITTNQGDSEILLVENDTVYYRSSNRLYSRVIEGAKLGEAKLLATDELIRDAHWAFVSRR